MSGTLFIVATPIGNLGDITLRALETLKTVDRVACEDTRRSGALLSHFGIRKPLLRYDDHTHRRAGEGVIALLSAGENIALVTDAGTPGLSDPGARLVAAARTAGVRVVTIPGPSAVTAAVSVSGFGADGFVFLGFLPRRDGRARRVLQEAMGLGRTVVFFESPFRVEKAVQMVAETAPQAEVVLAREMTKLHEEIMHGEPGPLLNILGRATKKGEFVVVVNPRPGNENA